MFIPWVGDQYGNSEILGGKRILVVGESHHSKEHPKNSIAPNLTQDVMKFYGSTQVRGEWMRTLDNFAWALSGKKPSELVKVGSRGEFDIWQSVAFYNYIPVVMTDSARNERPTSEHFSMAVQPFEKVLNDLKPDVLMIWGYGLFPYIIRNHWPSALAKPWDFRGDFLDVERGSRIRAIRMLHPSAAFSHSSWHSILSDAVNGM